MAKLHLEREERIILQRENVLFLEGDPQKISEMFLTNQRIVCVGTRKTGLFKSEEVKQSLRIDQINIIGGRAQASCEQKSFEDDPVLQIGFRDGRRSFAFLGGDLLYLKQKKEIASWIDAINHLLLNTPTKTQDAYNATAIPGAAAVADLIRGTVGTFASAFAKENRDQPKAVTTVCTSCGAKISGYQNQTKNCTYCSNPITF
jgi:hypothetical protein